MPPIFRTLSGSLIGEHVLYSCNCQTSLVTPAKPGDYHCIYKIVGGQSYCPDDVKAVLDKDNAMPIFGKKLTRREVQIMRMSFKYKTNQKMADALCLSRAAVRFHKANIYKKCGGETPVDILCNGIIKGIILPEDLE